jgi:hypothetical protein
VNLPLDADASSAAPKQRGAVADFRALAAVINKNPTYSKFWHFLVPKTAFQNWEVIQNAGR